MAAGLSQGSSITGLAERGGRSRFPKDRHSKGEPNLVIAGKEEAFFTTDMEEGDRAGLC